MPLYEHVYLARQDVSPQQVETMTKEFSDVIENGGGKIAKSEYWGVKSLAYKIKKSRKAHYTLLNIEAPPAAVAEMERLMGLSTDVVRFITIRVEEHETEPSIMMRKSDRDDRGDRGGFRGGGGGGFRGGGGGGFRGGGGGFGGGGGGGGGFRREGGDDRGGGGGGFRREASSDAPSGGDAGSGPRGDRDQGFRSRPAGDGAPARSSDRGPSDAPRAPRAPRPPRDTTPKSEG